MDVKEGDINEANKYIRYMQVLYVAEFSQIPLRIQVMSSGLAWNYETWKALPALTLGLGCHF